MKRKIFASRNRNNNSNNKAASAAAPAAIDVITLEIVVTDLRAAPSPSCYTTTTTTTRYQPFYQITNRHGKVLGRSAVVWDCVLDASFPTVCLSWNDVVVEKNEDASTSSAAVVMREPLLITLYDFNHHPPHHHTHTILGQVQTTLLELVDKTVPQQSSHNSNASTLLSLAEDEDCRFAVIWEDAAVVGDLYVKDMQFHQSTKGRHRRRLTRSRHSLSPPTHFEVQPGFPHYLRNVLAPPGIPAQDVPPEQEECTTMIMSTHTHTPNVIKSSSSPMFGSFDQDDTLSTADTEPWTEPSTSYCESPPASPRAQVHPKARKCPQYGEERQHHCEKQQHYQERSQELLEVARRRREQHQLRLLQQQQRGKDDHRVGVVVVEPAAQRPHGYYQYAQGRTEDLIARAKRLVSDRTSNLGKGKEQHNMFGGADGWMGCMDL